MLTNRREDGEEKKTAGAKKKWGNNRWMALVVAVAMRRE